MSALTFKLRQSPQERLDLSALTPTRLAGMAVKEIESLAIGTAQDGPVVGDLFKVSGKDTGEIRFEGTSSLCDRIGAGMKDGRIVVDGDAGAYLGAAMAKGAIAVSGSADALAGASMSGGAIDIAGNAGAHAAGPIVGELFGMKGGRISIGGDAGPMLAERMRRGIVTVGGDAGEYAGARVVSGTIVFMGKVGRYAGYGSKRGSLIFKKAPKEILPTFVDCGVIEFTYLNLLERELKKDGIKVKLGRAARRLMGDMATKGKGEMLILQ